MLSNEELEAYHAILRGMTQEELHNLSMTASASNPIFKPHTVANNIFHDRYVDGSFACWRCQAMREDPKKHIKHPHPRMA